MTCLSFVLAFSSIYQTLAEVEEKNYPPTNETYLF